MSPSLPHGGQPPLAPDAPDPHRPGAHAVAHARRAGADLLRCLAPRPLRERLYAWHPGRAARWRRHPGIERVAPGAAAVLTFDDGPDEDATPLVLDALARCGARATFFVLAGQVAPRRELVLEAVRRGHEIGLHGFEHRRHDRIDATASREDLRRGVAVLEDLLGEPCRWYRPPYGKMSPSAAQACEELGLTTVYWSAWGMDWEELSAARIASLVGSQISDGCVILLHDSSRHARRRSARPTAEAIPLIAAAASRRGLSLVSLGEAVGAAGDSDEGIGAAAARRA